MIDGTVAAGGADTGASADAGAAAPISTAGMSDEQILDSPSASADAPASGTADPGAAAASTPDAALPPVTDPAAVVDDTPAWIKTIADQKLQDEAKADFQSLKAFREAGFSDPAAVKAIAENLPGGRDQLDAMITTSKMAEEREAAMGSTDPAVIAPVIGQYLSGDNAGTIFREGAKHLATANPAAWGEIAGELVKSTLAADGMTDVLAGLGDAIAKGDAEYVGKFLTQAQQWAEKRGLTPGGKAATPQNPEMQRLQQERDKANAATLELKTTAYKGSLGSTVKDITTSINASIASSLSKVLPDNASPELKERLNSEINTEIDKQMGANVYLQKQIIALVGTTDKPRLEATADDFAKAKELSSNGAKTLVANATKKVVESWSKITTFKANETAAKAAAAGQKTEVGSSGNAPSNGKANLPANWKDLSDMDILNLP